MKQTILKMLAATTLIASSLAANATLMFTGVSLTENSLTFTVNGDLSGYDLSDTHNGLTDMSIIYYGDVWNGTNTGSSSNSWLGQIFNNNNIVGGGTGKWQSANLYTWIDMASLLSAADTATNNTVTLSLNSNFFNPNFTNGYIEFIAGWGNSTATSRQEVLGTFGVNNAATIPEPTSVAVLGAALMLLTRVKRKAK